MKTKILQTQFVTVLFLFGFLFIGNFTKAQSDENVTVYFSASVSTRDYKTTVVSPLFSAVIPDTSYARSMVATDFKDAFYKYVMGEMGVDVSVGVRIEGPKEDRQQVENDRQETMKRERVQKRDIVHTYSSFYYSFDTSKL